MKQRVRKPPAPLALVTSGPTRHSLFARFPSLGHRLGPIQATSPRTATRAARVLGGGWSAANWAEVLGAELIVVQAAGHRLFSQMRQLGRAAWNGRVVLACDAAGAELRDLAALEQIGAIVVHLHSLDQREPLVALSGDPRGSARARRLLAQAGVRSLTIRDGAGGALLASIEVLERAIAGALQDAGRQFQTAGLRGPEARFLSLGAALRALRR